MVPMDGDAILRALQSVQSDEAALVVEELRGELARSDRSVGLCVGTVLLGALALHRSERDGDGPIRSFGDALWAVLDLVSTVGSGTCSPVTPAGRLVGGLLMVFGTPLFAKSRDKAVRLLEDFADRVGSTLTLSPAELPAEGETETLLPRLPVRHETLPSVGDDLPAGTAESRQALASLEESLDRLDRRRRASDVRERHERKVLKDLLDEVARDEKNELDLLVRMAKTLPGQHQGLTDVSRRLAEAEALLAEVVERSRRQTDALEEVLADMRRRQSPSSSSERAPVTERLRGRARGGGDDASYRGAKAKNVFDAELFILDDDD